MTKPSAEGKIIIISFILLTFALLTMDVVLGPKTVAKEKTVKQEFDLIQGLKEATLDQLKSIAKTGQVMVIGYYQSDMDFSDISKYYDEELSKHGWRFYKNESFSEYGTNYGGSEVIYKKGEYLATLSHSGKAKGFSFAVRWKWQLFYH